MGFSADANGRAGQNDNRPGLVFFANVITPYRANLHRLIAAGIPELKLHTLITHGVGDFDWCVDVSPEIHMSNFSRAGERSLDHTLRRPHAEWRKARQLIRYLKNHNARAVICGSYRYISYLRVMEYCYRARIPFFVNLDSNIRSETQLSPLKRLIKRNIYRWWLKRASGVLSMGTLGDQYFLKYGAIRAGFTASRIGPITNHLHGSTMSHWSVSNESSGWIERAATYCSAVASCHKSG